MAKISFTLVFYAIVLVCGTINLTTNDECGRSNYNFDSFHDHNDIPDRDISPGQWPWAVRVFTIRLLNFPSFIYEFRCSGTLLTKKHVVTAAQCLQLSSIRNYYIPPNLLAVASGDFNLRQLMERGMEARWEVARYKIHPKYAHTNDGQFDLAILTLRTPVEISNFTMPICLWSGSTSFQNVVNRTGYVAGYGLDIQSGIRYEQLRVDIMLIMSPEDCNRTYGYLTSCAKMKQVSSNRSSDSCIGDSGSGLMLLNNTTGRYELHGVVARSSETNQYFCTKAKSIVFVDVTECIDWIQQQLGRFQPSNDAMVSRREPQINQQV